MHTAVRSPLMTGVALVGASAIAIAPVAVPPEAVEVPALSVPTSLTVSTDPLGVTIALIQALISVGQGVLAAVPTALQEAVTHALAFQFDEILPAVQQALLTPVALPLLVDILPKLNGLIAIVTGDDLAEALTGAVLLPGLLLALGGTNAVNAVISLFQNVAEAALSGDIGGALAAAGSGVSNVVAQVTSLTTSLINEGILALPGNLLDAANLPDLAAFVRQGTDFASFVVSGLSDIVNSIVSGLLGAPSMMLSVQQSEETVALAGPADTDAGGGEFVSLRTDDELSATEGSAAQASESAQVSETEKVGADTAKETPKDTPKSTAAAVDAADDDDAVIDMTDGNKTEPGSVTPDVAGAADDNGSTPSVTTEDAADGTAENAAGTAGTDSDSDSAGDA